MAATKDRLLKLVDELIGEGESVVATKGVPPGNWMGQPPVFVDLARFSTWAARCKHLAFILGRQSKPWRKRLTAQTGNEAHYAVSLLGTVRAIRKAIDDDLLLTVEDLVFAEAFDDLLGQADYLLGKGYLPAAGTLGRAVLEEHLRKWCQRVNITPAKQRPTLADLRQALYQVKKISKVENSHIEALTTIGNQAAHGEPVTQAEVERLLREVREFMVRHTGTCGVLARRVAPLPRAKNLKSRTSRLRQ